MSEGERQFVKSEAQEAMREGRLEMPDEIHQVLGMLGDKGYHAYVVGGCLRDVLLGRTPKDWDIATNAPPQEIQETFPDSFYENKFGTVGVKTGSKDLSIAVVDVTTFRRDIGYSDKRHPDRIEFADTIEEDLARRDFTINAMAYDGVALVDPFSGREDLEARTLRAVGGPSARFGEDALRMMRAARFIAELDFSVERETDRAIREHAALLERIAKDRIREELHKLIMGQEARKGIEFLREFALLRYVLPELEEGWGVGQNKHHIYTVWEHNVRALQYAADQHYSFEVRLAALLHDAGKPRAKKGEGPDCTFYGHEFIGGRMAAEMLARLHFSKREIEKIALLVRSHMFQYDPNTVTDASVRRLVTKVGPENIRELVQLREADRIGSGVAKAVPYQLRHFLFRVEKVLHEPISRKAMVVNGEDVIAELGIRPGKRVGAILDLLFEDILDNPANNNKEYLSARMRERADLSDEKLSEMRAAARKKYAHVLAEEEGALKEKYRV